jgi:phosphate transport system substrate-binding protein
VNRKWPRPLAVLGIVPVLALAACGSSGAQASASAAAGGGGEGEIFVSGSSTVEPITNAVAEAFAAENDDFEYTVEGPGTGDGFALFCDGQTDISDASRAISEEEAAICEQNGIEYVELLVAYDGLSVITAQDNPVECLSFLDLYALLGPESEGFGNWTDANDLAAELEAEFGDEYGTSHAPYPDAALEITAPGEESGTYDSFVEIVFGDISEARAAAGAIGEEQVETSRIDYQASPNDNVIVENIAGSPGGIGWVGLAFASQATGVKSVEVDGGDGCVAASEETVADESYPISRPLFIYPSLAAVETNPSLASFVDFYVSPDGLALAGDVGYVTLTEEQAQATRDAWDAR